MSVKVAYRTDTESARLTSMADALSVSDGGFSFSVAARRFVTGGYAVAVHPDREQRLMGKVTSADLSAYAFRNADLLIRTGAVFGGWRDGSTGVVYLDVSQTVATREAAVSLARRHNQVAYWDFAAGRSVKV